MDPQRIMLGAYQYIDIEPYVDEQFGPDTVKAVLTTSMDEPFANRRITAILSKQAQIDLAHAFSHDEHYERARDLLRDVLVGHHLDGTVLEDEIRKFLGVKD